MEFDDLAFLLATQFLLIALISTFFTLTLGACGCVVLGSGLSAWFFVEKTKDK